VRVYSAPITRVLYISWQGTFRGRAIAQAVSRRLPTAAARACGICGGQIGNGASFLGVLRFPLPILIPPTALHLSSSIIRCWYNRSNSGRRTKWTQSYLIPRRDIHGIRERGCHVRFSLSVSAGIVRGLPLAPERLAAQRYRDILQNVLPRLLEDVPLALRQRLWF
jgi:hypothetical protein